MTTKGFDDKFIEELKSKCDIVSTMSRYLTLQKKGKTYWACCPFHYEKTPSFAINEIEQYYHCFGCGESGDVIKFISKYENLNFVESVKLLANSCGMKLPEIEDNSKDLEQLRAKEKVLKALNFAMDFYHENLVKEPTSSQSLEYVKKRNFSKEILETFKIGYSSDWNSLIKNLESLGVTKQTMKMAGLIETSESGNTYDVFGTRLIFPILNSFGDCIGFTARTLESNPKFAKYKNSAQSIIFDKSRTIYNINSIKNLKKEQKIDYIIICEGTIDVIKMFEADFKNTVACLGTALTSYHAHELKKYTDKILLCLDGDDAGQNAMFKAIDVLYEEGFEVKVVALKENLDPDEFLVKYGKEELQKCLDNAFDAYEYKLQSLSKKFNLKDSFEKSKYVAQALDIIDSLQGMSSKDIYLKVLSKIVNISVDVLRRDLLALDNGGGTSKIVVEQKEEKELISNLNGLTKAYDYVLACLVHKKDYAVKNLQDFPTSFKNPSHQKLFEFLKKNLEENKTWTISSLFDYFDVDEDETIKKIIDFNFESFQKNDEVYFFECLNKIKLNELEISLEELKEKFKFEKDLDKRREIAMKLGKISKELKSKTGEK